MIRKYCSLLVILLTSLISYTQPPAGGGPPGFPTGTPPGGAPSATGGAPCWYAECIPIDSGIVFLLISGLGIGISFLYRRKKTTP